MSAKTVTQTIVIDCLEVNFYGTIPLKSDYLTNRIQQLNNNCYIEFLTQGNAMYNVIGNLYVYDRKIGELRFSPRKVFFDNDMINLKIDNVHLYGSEFIGYIDYCIEVLKFKYDYISLIDFASDVVGSTGTEFIKKFWIFTDPSNPISKTYGTRHKGRINRDDIDPRKIIHWGKIVSDKYIKIYDKKLELLEVSPEKASYIHAFWQLNGLPYENNSIERHELTLRRKHAKVIDYKQLNNPNYLASVMRTHYKNFFDFEKTYTNHGKKYVKDVTPIKFDNFNTVKLDKYKYIPKYTLRGEHTTIKTMYTEYLTSLYISQNFYVTNNVTKVPERLKEPKTIIYAIDTLLAKYPSSYLYFNAHKTGWEKEFESSDLFNNRISIEDYVTTIQFNESILFDIPDYSDDRSFMPYYQNLSNEELMYQRIQDNRMKVFNEALELIEIEKLQQDNPRMKKISQVAKNRIENNFKQSITLRRITESQNEAKTKTIIS